MKQTLTHQLIIAAVAAFVFFTHLGVTQLWDEDEAFFAATAAEISAMPPGKPGSTMSALRVP